MTLDEAIWWTGAAVLSAGAALMAAGVVFVLSVAAVWIGTHYAARFGRVPVNLHLMHQWVRAGRPVWTEVQPGHKEMRPQSEEPSA